jgi:peptidoglycan/LPS O-acetylase OafA/YrhL
MTVDSSKQYYPGVDLVRFLSALLVVFFHIGYGSWAKPTSRSAKFIAEHDFSLPLAGWLGFSGWIGVQIFFVVSGLVITQSANGRSPIEFAKGRLYRLYPGVWVCATITLLMTLPFDVIKDPMQAYLRSMTLFPAGPWIDIQYWTLPYEIFFYGLVFLLLLGRAFVHIEKLALGLVALAAVSWLGLSGYEATGGQPPEFIRNRLMEMRSHGLPFFYGSFFGLGILIALWRRGSITAAGYAGAVVALAVSCWQIYDRHVQEMASPSTFMVSLEPYWLVPVGVFLAAVAVIVLSTGNRFAVTSQQGGIMRALGLATYPLYLIHLTTGALMLGWLISLGLQPALAFAITISVLIALSLVIAMVFEAHLRRALRATIERLEKRLPRWPRFYTPGGAV